jgi:hypothetical protein
MTLLLGLGGAQVKSKVTNLRFTVVAKDLSLNSKGSDTSVNNYVVITVIQVIN